MNMLALLLSVILAILSALHFYWALGGRWPGKDDSSLARTVIGRKGAAKMPPPLLTVLVAMALLAAACWPLMWRAIIPYGLPQTIVWLGMAALMIVFLARGIAGYLPVFRNRLCEQPFARLNARYFSPLCLLLGAGFAILLVNV